MQKLPDGEGRSVAAQMGWSHIGVSAMHEIIDEIVDCRPSVYLYLIGVDDILHACQNEDEAEDGEPEAATAHMPYTSSKTGEKQTGKKVGRKHQKGDREAYPHQILRDEQSIDEKIEHIQNICIYIFYLMIAILHTVP